MKFLVLCALVGFAACDNSKTQGKFVYDLLKIPLSQAEVAVLLASKDASYPKHDANNLPKTAFACASKAQPGFYADPETQCQVFHRCDQSLLQTDYICVSQTV